MDCLVVGGTGFLGGAISDALAAQGHSVTVLSRGQTPRKVAVGLETVQADRHDDLRALSGRRFDWVFDTCAYTPDAVEALLAAVGDGIARYVLISSVSAYGSFAEPGLSETAQVPDATDHDLAVAAQVSPKDRASAFAYGASYGPLKRACELKAQQMLGTRVSALRVGLLVGAGDYTDRLTWWVRRIDQATGDRQRVPAPAPKDRSVQFIDVRDAAEFAVRCAADALPGIWNVTGQPLGLKDILTAIAQVSGSGTDFVWVSEEAIAAAGIVPWVDIPMMAPSLPEFRYFLEVGTRKAGAAGLTCRPVEDTLGPLLEWDRTRRDTELKCGMTAAQEAELIRSSLAV